MKVQQLIHKEWAVRMTIQKEVVREVEVVQALCAGSQEKGRSILFSPTLPYLQASSKEGKSKFFKNMSFSFV